MKYQFPDEDTLGKYHALLMAVLIEARWLSCSPGNHKRVAELMDAVENLPDLLCRWPDMKEDWILADLESYERKYYDGISRFTSIIREGPRADWQLKWLLSYLRPFCPSQMRGAPVEHLDAFPSGRVQSL